MGLPDAFVAPMAPCLNPNFKFPSISEPGMPNFVLSTFMATFAGINFVLQFIPPTPTVIPKIKPPSLSLFTDAFMASLNLPSLPGFDPSGVLKLIQVCIQLPFQLITKLVTGLLQLKIEIPTLSGINALFTEISLSVGLEGPAVAKFGTCIAESIADLFSSLI